MTPDPALEDLEVDVRPDLHDLFTRPARPRELDAEHVYDEARGVPTTDDPDTWMEYDPIVAERNRQEGRKHRRMAAYSWSSPQDPTELIDALCDTDRFAEATVFISKPGTATIEDYCEQEGLQEGYHLLEDAEGRKRPHFETRSTPGFVYSDTPDAYWTGLDDAFDDRAFRALYRGDQDAAAVDDAVGFRLDIGERNGLRVAVDWKYDDGARVHVAAHDHQPEYLDALYDATDGRDLGTAPSDLLVPE